MKVVAVLSAFLLAATADAGYLTETQNQREFTRFVKLHGKKYVTDDFFNRYEIFKTNLDLINQHNSKPGVTSTMGVNQFSDFSSSEFASRMSLNVPAKPNKLLSARATRAAPASLDWREEGGVTAVKDQGSCGSW